MIMITLYDLYDADNTLLGVGAAPQDGPEALLGTTFEGSVVASYAENQAQSRRNERAVIFANTIDRMNPTWHAALTDAQRTELETWRQGWLDYPSTGVYPSPLDWFSGT